MKISLKITAFLALIPALLASPIAAAEKLVVGTEGAYPPFNYLEADGTLGGFDVDIAKALCEEMKVECEFVTQDWDGAIPALIAGKYDIFIASMSITEERKQKIDFSEKYYNTPPAIAVAKDSKISNTAGDLKGKILGAQSSTTHSNYAEAYFKDSELRLYPTPDEYKLDLANGRIDAVIDDVVVLDDWLKSDDGSCCRLVGTLKSDPTINGEGAGVALRKGEDALRERINKAIQAILKNGKYKAINDKYFEFSVY